MSRGVGGQERAVVGDFERAIRPSVRSVAASAISPKRLWWPKDSPSVAQCTSCGQLRASLKPPRRLDIIRSLLCSIPSKAMAREMGAS